MENEVIHLFSFAEGSISAGRRLMIESEQHSERAELAVTHASVYAQKADRNAIHVCVCR